MVATPLDYASRLMGVGCPWPLAVEIASQIAIAVSESFPSRAEAEELHPDVEDLPLFIRTAGFLSPQDGGGGLYALLDEEPDDPTAPQIIQITATDDQEFWYQLTDDPINLAQFGALGDAREVGTTLTISSGTKALTVAGGDFTAADIGKVISIPGAGAASAALITTVSAVTDATHLTIASNASTSLVAAAGSVLIGTDDVGAMQSAFDFAKEGRGLQFVQNSSYLFTAQIEIDQPTRMVVYGNNCTAIPLFASDVSVFSMLEPVDVKIQDIHFDGVARYGSVNVNTISGRNPIRTIVENCSFFDYGKGAASGGTAVVLFQSGIVYTNDDLVGNYILDCYADGNNVGQGGFILTSMSYSSIVDCHVKDLDRITPDPSFGVDLKNDCFDCHVLGCTATNCDVGVLLTSTSNVDGEGPNHCSVVDFISTGCRVGFNTAGGADCFVQGLIDMQGQGDRALAITAHGLRHEHRIAIRNQAVDTLAIKCESNHQVVTVTSHDGSISGSATLFEYAVNKGFIDFTLESYDTSTASFNPQSLIVNSSAEVSNRYHFGDTVYCVADGPGQLRLPTGSAFTRNSWIALNTTNDIMSFTVDGHDMVHINEADLRFVPAADNELSLGSASFLWTEVFAATGTINTSDAREKTTVSPFTNDEIAAAKELAAEIGTFKFLQAIDEKGDDARTHIGMTVQRAIEIMEGHGLDPMRYGFICYDEWTDQTVDGFDETGDPTGEQVVTRAAGNRYGFRKDELMLFIARGFEARLAALEGA